MTFSRTRSPEGADPTPQYKNNFFFCPLKNIFCHFLMIQGFLGQILEKSWSLGTFRSGWVAYIIFFNFGSSFGGVLPAAAPNRSCPRASQEPLDPRRGNQRNKLKKTITKTKTKMLMFEDTPLRTCLLSIQLHSRKLVVKPIWNALECFLAAPGRLLGDSCPRVRK